MVNGPRMRRIVVSVLACSLALAACRGRGVYTEARAYVQARGQIGVPAVEVIKPHNTIGIQVFGEPNLSNPQVQVRPNGTITLPLVGVVEVEGQRPDEVAKVLEQKLSPFLKSANVTVAILQSTTTVYFLGELGTQGKVEFNRPTTLVEAIASVGGLGNFANKSGLFLLRKGERIRFDYWDIARGADYTRGFLMEQGDVLVAE